MAEDEQLQKNSRYGIGLQQLAKLDHAAAGRVMQNLEDIAPDMSRFIVEFAYGDIYSRPGLDLKARQVATIAALTALGNAEPQLKFHIGAALNIGVTPAEIIEVMYITTVFTGFPAGLNGISAAKAVFKERGVVVEKREAYTSHDRRERGLKALASTSAGSGRTVVDSLKDIAPDMGTFILDFSYGDIFARKIIPPRWKEIAIIAATISKGTMKPQLKVHLKAALNVGCTQAELLELIYQMTVYAGFPAALNGLGAAREVFESAP